MPRKATEQERNYRRGWNASRQGGNALENADMRGEPSSWYDGYYDNAAGRDKWHSLTCADPSHVTCN